MDATTSSSHVSEPEPAHKDEGVTKGTEKANVDSSHWQGRQVKPAPDQAINESVRNKITTAKPSAKEASGSEEDSTWKGVETRQRGGAISDEIQTRPRGGLRPKTGNLALTTNKVATGVTPALQKTAIRAIAPSPTSKAQRAASPAKTETASPEKKRTKEEILENYKGPLAKLNLLLTHSEDITEKEIGEQNAQAIIKLLKDYIVAATSDKTTYVDFIGKNAKDAQSLFILGFQKYVREHIGKDTNSQLQEKILEVIGEQLEKTPESCREIIDKISIDRELRLGLEGTKK